MSRRIFSLFNTNNFHEITNSIRQKFYPDNLIIRIRMTPELIPIGILIGTYYEYYNNKNYVKGVFIGSIAGMFPIVGSTILGLFIVKNVNGKLSI